jgi:hypothetical protein
MPSAQLAVVFNDFRFMKYKIKKAPKGIKESDLEPSFWSLLEIPFHNLL